MPGNSRLRRLTLAAVCAAASAFPADWRALKPEGYLSDFARVVDAASKAQIERYGEAVKRQTGAEISLVTVPALDGDPIEDAANTLFRAWGVGEKGKNNGVLLLLAIRERGSRLEVGYEIEPLIPDSLAGQILDEMRPALRQQHYGEAMLAAAHKIGSTVAQAKGVTLDTSLRRRLVRRPSERIPWLPLLFGGGMALFLMRAMAGMSGARRRRRAGFPMILPLPWGGGGWDTSRGGGGFGGYDSGDSFGGFGGGDSGGGGASSDW